MEHTTAIPATTFRPSTGDNQKRFPKLLFLWVHSHLSCLQLPPTRRRRLSLSYPTSSSSPPLVTPLTAPNCRCRCAAAIQHSSLQRNYSYKVYQFVLVRRHGTPSTIRPRLLEEWWCQHHYQPALERIDHQQGDYLHSTHRHSSYLC